MKPTPAYCYVALMDVLGYRAGLDLDRRNGQNVYLTKLVNAANVFGNINATEIGVRAISDTIIVRCSERTRLRHIVETIKDIQVSYLKQGMFIRGGLAYGSHFEHEAVTYSQALVRAHELECKEAMWPRVVIDRNVMEMVTGDPKMEAGLVESGLICHDHGVSFVNVLDATNWAECYVAGRGMYEEAVECQLLSSNVLAKHAWFQDYLLQSAHAPEDSTRYMNSIKLFRP